MSSQSMRVCAAGLAVAVLSVAAPARAQVVTFTGLRDAVPGKFFDPDPANTRAGTPNTLDIAFENNEFKASTIAPLLSPAPARNAMDTISFNVNAPAGYYVSSIAYHQKGTGTILRTARALGASSWVVGGQPANLGFFNHNPSELIGTTTYTNPGPTVVPVSITTGLFVSETLGDATLELTSATVVVTVAPLSPDDPTTSATIAVSGYTGTYDGAPHGATGTATGVNGEDLTHLLHLGDLFTDAPGGTATWTFSGDTNHNAATGTAAITINPADATIAVSGYTGTYDGAAHGATGTAAGVNGEDLTSLLDLGASFTNVVSDGTATWTFSGDTNYNAATGTAAITINPADATIAVSGFTGTYDGAAHGATGTARGVNAEDLTSLLDLGASFTNVPGGTATWTFDGNANYNAATGAAATTINKATPILTWPQPAAITAGTALTATQLNATANLDGTFVYDPPAGTVLTATQTLSVAFTPADAVNYTGAAATVTITVTANTGMRIRNPGPQTNMVGDEVRLRLRVTRLARGSDGGRRRGVWTAAGLPPGLQMDEEGEIRGRVTTVGTYPVVVTFTRNGITVSAQFDWTVLSRSAKGGKD